MTIIDFPLDAKSLSFDVGYCEPRSSEQKFTSTRSRVVQRTRRGPVLWEQVFSTITKGSTEAVLQGFLSTIDNGVGTLRCPDLHAETDQSPLKSRLLPTLGPFMHQNAVFSSPLSATVTGAHLRGATSITAAFNQGRVTLPASRRLQIGKGFYRLAEAAQTADNGTVSLKLYPGLRFDVADGTELIHTNAKALWFIEQVTPPQRLASGIYAREFTLFEDLKAVMAS